MLLRHDGKEQCFSSRVKNIMSMNVEIISPTDTLFKGEASAVTVPSKMGAFTLLEHHAPIVAILEAGKVSLTEASGEQKEFDIKGGFSENHDNHLTICVEL